jgi:hypothetical protein
MAGVPKELAVTVLVACVSVTGRPVASVGVTVGSLVGVSVTGGAVASVGVTVGSTVGVSVTLCVGVPSWPGNSPAIPIKARGPKVHEL